MKKAWYVCYDSALVFTEPEWDDEEGWKIDKIPSNPGFHGAIITQDEFERLVKCGFVDYFRPSKRDYVYEYKVTANGLEYVCTWQPPKK